MNIGPYRDLQEIGRGGMGVVYKARDSRNGRSVAIKRIQGLAPRSQQARLALMREAGMTAQLRHKNIVTVLDVGQQQGTLFIVMEYLDGHTLNQLMKLGKTLGFSQRVDIIRQGAVERNILKCLHGIVEVVLRRGRKTPTEPITVALGAHHGAVDGSPVFHPFVIRPIEIVFS
jgi:serine/threonine protein kinase